MLLSARHHPHGVRYRQTSGVLTQLRVTIMEARKLANCYLSKKTDDDLDADVERFREFDKDCMKVQKVAKACM